MIRKYVTLIASVLVIFSFGGCSTTKTLSRDLSKYVKPGMETPAQLPDFITLKLDFPQSSDSLVTVKRIKASVIPLILFSSWTWQYQCNINERFFENILVATLERKSVEYQLGNLLQDKHLELSLEQIPNEFVYNNSGMYMYLLYVYSYIVDQHFYMKNQAFRIKYRLMKGDVEIKQNTYNYLFQNVMPNTKFSFRDFENTYMTQLESDYAICCNKFVDDMVEDF